MSTGPRRVSVEVVRRKLQEGAPLLFVNAYPDSAYRRSHLEGSISMGEFLARLPSLPKDAEIVFY
ncbi:MAG TPA: ArsR family transcriptional regulator [Planctomycetota bacterium]